MPKPTNPVLLDTGHALIRNPVVCVPFTEGANDPKDLARPGYVAWRTQAGSGDGLATWGTNTDGPCGSAGATAHSWDLGSEDELLPLPTGACTVVVVRRKTDTSLRSSVVLGSGDSTAPSRLSLAAPASDGTVYFDYGGVTSPNRLTWTGYTPTANLEYWVFVAGPSGMAIYKDSATPKATSATAVTRTVDPRTRVYINSDGTAAARGDLQQISLVMVLATEWSAADVGTWLAAPYAFLLSGTPATLATPVTARLPDMSGLSPIPADALGGGTRTCTALDDFQAFLSGAGVITRGETVLVESGHTFQPPTAQYDGPNNLTGAGWSAFRPTAEGSMAPAGTRTSPADLPFMPVIKQSTVAGPNGIWSIKAPTEGLRIAGMSFHAADTRLSLLDVPLGDRSGVGAAPDGHRFFLDRCLVDRLSESNSQSWGIGLVGYDIRIAQCYLKGYQGGAGGDPKAIGGAATPGTHWIEDNYLAGCAGGVFYGGQSNIVSESHLPRDIVIRRNTIENLRRWMGTANPAVEATLVLGNAPEFVDPPTGDAGYGCKSTLELKCSQRVLIEGNTFINSWSWPAITLDSWNQNTGANPYQEPFNRVEDVTIRYNYCPPAPAGYGAYNLVQLWAANKPIRRITVHDNLAWAVYNRYGTVHFGYGEGAMGFFNPTAFSAWGMTDIILEHNTVSALRGTWAVQGTSGPIQRFRYRHNITGYGHGGISNDQNFNSHTDATIGQAIPFRDIATNAFVDYGDALGTPAVPYTQAQWSAAAGVADGQYLIVGTPAVAGISETTGRLTPTSPLRSGGIYQASDGTDNGVDFSALDAALAGSNPPPPQNVNLGLSAGTLGLLGRGLDISSITLDTTKRATVRPTPVMRPPVTSRPTKQ